MNLAEIKELFGSGDNPVVVLSKDKFSDGCGVACSKYIELIDHSLSLRCEKKKYSLDISDGLRGEVFCYFGDFAILDLTDSDFLYRKLIGDSSFSLVNRSINKGFVFKRIVVEDHSEDIFQILSSAKERSDRAVPAEWFDPEYRLPVWRKGLCSRHQESAFGVFDGEKLIAICTLRYFAELASINFIVGHANYLASGVMYFLIYQLRVYLRINRPEVKYLHYMWIGNPSYANYYFFKTGSGFKGRKVLFAQDAFLANCLERIFYSDEKEQEVFQVRKPKVVPPKLFKKKINLSQGGISTVLDSLVFEVIPSWYKKTSEDAKRLVELKLFLLDSIKKSTDGLMGLLDIKCVNDDNVRVGYVFVMSSDFSRWSSDSRDNFSLLFSRGDLVVFIVLNDIVDCFDESKFAHYFKNTGFQFLALSELNNLFSLKGRLLVLAKL